MGDVKNGYQATPNATLEQQMMDACAPKNEREWWAFVEIGRLRAEVEALRAERQVLNSAIVAAKSETAEFAEVAINAQNEVEALRADALKQVDCRQCKHATNRGCHSTALCERGELFEATPPWQFYDAARAAQGASDATN